MRCSFRVLISTFALATGLPVLAEAQPVKAPVSAAVPAVDSRVVANKLAARLESDFVYPEQGARYAAMLKVNANAGKYDTLKGIDLAKKLGEDLQNVARDGHLRVMYEGVGARGGPLIDVKRPPRVAGSTPKSAPQPVVVRMAPPPVMEHAGWIAPDIAFVRFNLFPGGQKSAEAAHRFMARHASARTFIFDIRLHRGGGLDEMDAMFPWLFAKPTSLVSLATRKSVDEAGGSPFGEQPSLRIVEADPNFVTREHWVTPGPNRRAHNARVFVLTSQFSGSAAEHFALAFKQSRRGTLIGRTTFGANHFGGDQDLGGGYTAFIPVGRAYDPVTGKDWEGTGITPHIEIAPREALVRALTLAGVPVSKARQLSASVAPRGAMADRL